MNTETKAIWDDLVTEFLCGGMTIKDFAQEAGIAHIN